MQELLNLNILQGRLLYCFYGLSLLIVIGLLIRSAVPPVSVRNARVSALDGPDTQPARPERSGVRVWLTVAGAALAAGALTGVLTLYVCVNGLDVFGMPLDPDTQHWVVAAFAAVALALANLWRSPWWRKAAAIVAVAVFLTTAALGINAGFGLNSTLGALLDIAPADRLTLPKLSPTASQSAAGSLWRSWKAPSGMPSVGRTGTLTIPPINSHFHARDAFVYLPPAALVANPPELPVLVMMMGQPGGPGQMKQAVPMMDELARLHQGLGPIVVTVDQLGSTYQNPLCVDSAEGQVNTYVTRDVVDYIRRSLNVAVKRSQWAVGGYSNGGECALSFGAKRPDLFASILDISGELEPRDGSVTNTVSKAFGGHMAAFDAEKPATILKAHRYKDDLAIFTSGSLDRTFTPQAVTARADAQAAGMTTLRFTGPGVGHRGDAVMYGLTVGLPVLDERFGLTAPGNSTEPFNARGTTLAASHRLTGSSKGRARGNTKNFAAATSGHHSEDRREDYREPVKKLN